LLEQASPKPKFIIKNLSKFAKFAMQLNHLFQKQQTCDPYTGVYELEYHCGSCGLSGWSLSWHTWCVSPGKDIGFLYPTPHSFNINYIDTFVIDGDDKAHTLPPTGAGILLTAWMKGGGEEV
jgi:hypothetical protein